MQDLAVVTGGGSGIGRALAVELAQKYGLKVLVVGRTKTKLEQTCAIHSFISACVADVSTAEGREKIFHSMQDDPNLRYLVHNAAVLGPVLPLSKMELTEWRKHQQINVEGPLFLTQKLLSKMKQGRILHISSGAAHHAYAGWGAYCSSKASLFMIYQVLRTELEQTGNLIGSVRPGVVDTPMQDELRQAEPAVFPEWQKFVNLKKESQLLSPVSVAKFIAALLVKSTDTDFSAQEWDFREHQNRFSD